MAKFPFAAAIINCYDPPEGMMLTGGRMQRRDFFILMCGAAAWPLVALAQNESFTIGPPANPAAKLRAQEKAAADRRQKAKEKEDECRKRAVVEKIPARERKSFTASCIKTTKK